MNSKCIKRRNELVIECILLAHCQKHYLVFATVTSRGKSDHQLLANESVSHV